MEQSQLTIMVYLNDSFTGGNTNFLDDNSKPHTITYALKPETGIRNIYITKTRLEFQITLRNDFNFSA